MALSIGERGIKEFSTVLESCFFLTATEEVEYSNKMCSDLISITSRNMMIGLRT
jgi:hypothetical protein